ncbi:MAG TPA: hypothetical protein VKM55_10450, partial [Candidatus Lokiarchaeia archaeon]|nr:hypothetical protein [Candidatus Lokiarchaeia archaeon]
MARIKILTILFCISFFCLSNSSTTMNSPSLNTRAPSSAISGHAVLYNWTSAVLPSMVTNRLQRNYTLGAGQQQVSVPTTTSILQANMSFSNITINDISDPLETLVQQSQNASFWYDTYYYQEISIPGSCYIPWLSIFEQYNNQNVVAQNWTFSIYNATANNTLLNPAPIPNKQLPGLVTSFNPAVTTVPYTSPDYNMAHWKNLTMPKILITKSETYQYKGLYRLYVCAKIPGGWYSQRNYWYFNNHTQTGGAISSVAYEQSQGFKSGALAPLPGIRFTLVMELIPAVSNPQPSAIDLKVNEALIGDAGTAKGYYSTNEPMIAENGVADYQITSDWSSFPGGSLECTIGIDYIDGTATTPSVTCSVFTRNTMASWNATYAISFVQQPKFPTADLIVNVPLTWTVISITNITGTSRNEITWTSQPGPTGQYNVLMASGITPGRFLLACKSHLVTGNLVLGLSKSGQVDLDTLFQGNLTLDHGPNGMNTTLQSDYEGQFLGFNTTIGASNGSDPQQLQYKDGKVVRFSNTETVDVLSLFLDIIFHLKDLATFIYPKNLSTTFNVKVNTPDGFKQENLKDVGLEFDYSAFNLSLGIGNTTALNVPANPAWNINNVAANNLFFYCLLYDNTSIPINFTYNKAAKQYSDLYANFTARGVENGTELPKSRIASIALDFGMNFTKSSAKQTLFIKNQVTKQYVLMNSTLLVNDEGSNIHMHWNSTSEGITNASIYVNPVKNTIETYIHTVNMTTVSFTHKVQTLDLALCTFTYKNTFTNYTVALYNWNSGKFTVPIVVRPQFGSKSFVISAKASGLNPADVFNATSGMVRVAVNASAFIPIFNNITWDVDRVLLKVTYTNFVQCTWQQGVTSALGTSTFSNQTETFFNSPQNNFSISIPVDKMLDYCDNYTYAMTWNNETDIGFFQDPFGINREGVTLVIPDTFSGHAIIAGNYINLESRLAYTKNDTGLLNESLVFAVTAIKRDGTVELMNYSTISGSDGNALWNMQVSSDWQSFYFFVTFISKNPRIRSLSTNPTSTMTIYTTEEYDLQMLISDLPFLAIVAGLIIAIGVVNARVKTKRQVGWNREAEKVRDVLKIRHLLVIMKDSGLCVVDRAYSEMNLDA